jgi:hypothetical protein
VRSSYDDEAEAQQWFFKNWSFAGAHCETIERALYTLYGGLAAGFAAAERLNAQKLLSFAHLSALTHGRSAARSGVAS